MNEKLQVAYKNLANALISQAMDDLTQEEFKKWLDSPDAEFWLAFDEQLDKDLLLVKRKRGFYINHASYHWCRNNEHEILRATKDKTGERRTMERLFDIQEAEKLKSCMEDIYWIEHKSNFFPVVRYPMGEILRRFKWSVNAFRGMLETDRWYRGFKVRGTPENVRKLKTVINEIGSETRLKYLEQIYLKEKAK